MTLPRPAAEPRIGRPTQLSEFQARLEELAGHGLDDVNALHAWTVEHAGDFWRELLRWSQLPWSGDDEVALVGQDIETARFLPDVRLNYAEALLRPLPSIDDDSPALTAVHAGRPAERWTRAELRAEVRRTAAALAGIGLQTGDRIVLIGPNSGRTTIVALAAAALAAPLATATPDMGATALLGRLEQVEPVVLALDRTGTAHDTLPDLLAGLPTLRRVVILDDQPLPDAQVPVDRLDDLLPVGQAVQEGWTRHPFDTPLFVMFSSGTTGPPKAIVHGIGGPLLEHIKEHRLHNDMGPADVYFHHTTIAWMVWNRCLSALASGTHLVFYDGPVSGPRTLWELVAEHGVTVFGTSPAYLQLCEDAGYRPAESVDLSRLRAVLSSGSVLEDWQYDWVADAVGPVSLWSSSGGTDLLGAFVLSHPELPVPRGRIQMRSLGMDVAAVDDDGNEVIGQIGELVCRNAFPSRPVGFLRDPDGSRMHQAYFVQNAGMWTHGDRIDFRADGSSRLHGRSDGVLNIDGLRIGPSEIYAVLRRVPEIADSMAIEQRDPRRPGVFRMVLLVVLSADVELDDDLARRVRRLLRQQASAAHVPSVIVAVPELPLTHNGKKSERAARDAANGDLVVNLTALRNPGCLDAIRTAVEQARTVRVAAAVAADDVERIWCDVLQIARSGPDDDFNDLGGTSRELMGLLRRIKVDLGVEVPLQALEAPLTLAGLGEAVAVRREEKANRVPLLRSGRGAPLFVIGDAWGQLNSYVATVEQLDTGRPVHGVTLDLVDDGGRHRTIPELAADAVAVMRKIQPTGPYSLLGYSFGGLVAYDMAVRLTEGGESVASIGLLDVRPTAASLTRGEALARRLVFRIDMVLSGDLLPAVRRRLRLLGRSARLDSATRFFAGSQEVARSYRLPRYDGPVTYYLAERRLPVVGNTLSAWRRVARKLLVTEVPGYHWDIDERRPGMLSARYAGALAEKISADLR